jgi:hypothetical protein
MPPEVSSGGEESNSINDINDVSDMSLNDQNIEINESDQNMSISEDSGDRSMSISEDSGDRSMSISDDGDRSLLISDDGDLLTNSNKDEDNGDRSLLISDDDNLLISETNSNKDEDILEDTLEESEPEVNANYPNEAYGDLMALVTKHKLTNNTGNAIIRFFNKYANLDTSPLPKSIEQGRIYMDNMNLPSLTYKKTCVTIYNNKEYYLHHRLLLNCVKNILSTSDISQNFMLTFDHHEVIISVN